MANRSLFDLTGAKALVTGGAMGIGRTAALALASAGADVAIVDLSEEVGERTVTSVKEIGRDSVFVHCDVAEATQVEAMVEAVVHRFGRLDIAVNNAGTISRGADADLSEQDWDDVIAVNLTGTWLCARAEMRQMTRQTPTEGKIINMASIAAGLVCGSESYDASKAAVVQLSKTLAAQWGRFNINVNSLSPGFVIAALGRTRSLDERERLRKATPLGHAQRLEDLSGPILFLASKASDYVTGQNLVVDGGYTLNPYVSFERALAPRVEPAGEVMELIQDLDARGVAHDEDGVILE